MASLLNTATDGWVPPGDWEAIKFYYQELFDAALGSVSADSLGESADGDDPIKTEKDLREVWPFDLS